MCRSLESRKTSWLRFPRTKHGSESINRKHPKPNQSALGAPDPCQWPPYGGHAGGSTRLLCRFGVRDWDYVQQYNTPFECENAKSTVAKWTTNQTCFLLSICWWNFNREQQQAAASTAEVISFPTSPFWHPFLRSVHESFCIPVRNGRWRAPSWGSMTIRKRIEQCLTKSWDCLDVSIVTCTSSKRIKKSIVQ